MPPAMMADTPDFTRALNRLGGDPRAADDHAALQIGRNAGLRSIPDRAACRHADRSERLAADSEDALDEGDVRFDRAAFTGNDLSDLARQIGLHLNRHRRAANDHLTCDGGNRLDGAGDLGLVLLAKLPKMPFVRASTSPGSMRSPSFFSMHSGTSSGGIDRSLARLSGVMSPGHERFSDDLPRLDQISRLHQHGAGNWQEASRRCSASPRRLSAPACMRRHLWLPSYTLSFAFELRIELQRVHPRFDERTAGARGLSAAPADGRARRVSGPRCRRALRARSACPARRRSRTPRSGSTAHSRRFAVAERKADECRPPSSAPTSLSADERMV